MPVEAKRIQLISNDICFGPCPKPDDEVEQHLTITDDGRVFFSSYCYGEGGKYVRNRMRNFRIAESVATAIVHSVDAQFSVDYNECIVTDIGCWNLILTDTRRLQHKYHGALYPGCHTELKHISDAIRHSLCMPELYVFDGNVSKSRRLSDDNTAHDSK